MNFILHSSSIALSIDVDAHLGLHKKANPYFVDICMSSVLLIAYGVAVIFETALSHKERSKPNLSDTN